MNLLKAIDEAGAMLSGHSPDIAAKTHLTLVTGVSKSLKPEVDFDINGTITASLPVDEFRKKFKDKTISDVVNLSERDFKVMWSDQVINPGDENSPFIPSLVARFVNGCQETGIVEVLALRNKYGSSLVRLPIQDI